MKERIRKPLPSMQHFLLRMATHLFIAGLIVVLGLGLGMVGYHMTEKMSWVDSFVNAAMILSGMGPLTPLATHGGKIFAGFYALFSGLLFIVLMSIVLAPILHRFLHKFHIDINMK